MITGRVDEFRNAVIPLVLVDSTGGDVSVQTILDTGFTGFLALPPALIESLEAAVVGWSRARLADGTEKTFPVFEVSMQWFDRVRSVEAIAAGNELLAGMRLFESHQLQIDVCADGEVVVRPIPGSSLGGMAL